MNQEPNNLYAPPKAALELPSESQYDTDSIWTPKGRFGRVDFIYYLTLMYLAVAVVGGIFSVLDVADHVFDILGTLLSAPLIICVLIFVARRVHDLGLKTWFCLLIFVPFVNFLLILALLALPGTDGPNQHGLPRRPPSFGRKAVALLFPMMAIVGFFAAILIPVFSKKY